MAQFGLHSVGIIALGFFFFQTSPLLLFLSHFRIQPLPHRTGNLCSSQSDRKFLLQGVCANAIVTCQAFPYCGMISYSNFSGKQAGVQPNFTSAECNSLFVDKKISQPDVCDLAQILLKKRSVVDVFPVKYQEYYFLGCCYVTCVRFVHKKLTKKKREGTDIKVCS